MATEEKKHFTELSDEDLKQVTGGKEQFPGSQEACKDQAPDKCTISFTTTTGDPK